MAGRIVIVGLVVFLGGQIARSTVVTSPISVIGATTHDNRQDIDATIDSEIDKILINLSNRVFLPDDKDLISMIVRSIKHAEKSNNDTERSSIEAGARKAQRFVADVTAAYTQSIFRATNARDAQDTLRRFQNTVQRIVDYSKNSSSES